MTNLERQAAALDLRQIDSVWARRPGEPFHLWTRGSWRSACGIDIRTGPHSDIAVQENPPASLTDRCDLCRWAEALPTISDG